MTKGRLEAFSDGVLAIVITIMVLELKVPHGDTLAALRPMAPSFLAYVLSFLYIGIYWNNHHHLLHTVKRAQAATSCFRPTGSIVGRTGILYTSTGLQEGSPRGDSR